MFARFYSKVAQVSKQQMAVPNIGKKFVEVEIPVPWGKLAGKYWGSIDNEPVLALHGWQDNASSFDNLIQYLPENISVLALDLPGHGDSSWLPKGQMYSVQHFAQAIHRVREHYGIDKIGIIGHCTGGVASFYYASLFPNTIKFIVGLDHCKFPILQDSNHVSVLTNNWTKFFKYEKLSASVPSYSEDEIIKKWIEATANLLDESACKVMLERGVVRQSDGTLSFSRDPRVKLMAPDIGLIYDHFRHLAKRIYCPYMLVKGDKSDNDHFLYSFFDMFKVIEEGVAPKHKYTVPGNHYFHINNAATTSVFVNPFILKHL